jgi:hypothetical protein
MNNDREPNDDAISLGEVKNQDISADTELDQGHAIEIQELPKPEVVEVCLQVVRGKYRIPDMSATAHRSCFVREYGTSNC